MDKDPALHQEAQAGPYRDFFLRWPIFFGTGIDIFKDRPLPATLTNLQLINNHCFTKASEPRPVIRLLAKQDKERKTTKDPVEKNAPRSFINWSG